MALRHMPQPQSSPSPERFFRAVNAYMTTEALKAAVELDLFTAIHAGARTAAEIASRCHTDPRRTRMLCDFLVTEELLTKHEQQYSLPPDSEMFLVRTSPAYLGDTLGFLLHSDGRRQYENLATVVRRGVPNEAASYVDDNPIWVDFARSMANMMRMPAEAIAQQLGADKGQPMKVLDIAAGHGIFGITIARHNPQATVVALDSAGVLEVAKENAQKEGVAARYTTLPGSAFDLDFGSGYDVVLLTNFLHHFDHAANVKLLKKVHAALKPGGLAVTLEFVPNEDRVTPPMAARFALIMLAGTPHGDAYPYSALQKMCQEAGFEHNELVRMPGPESLVISQK